VNRTQIVLFGWAFGVSALLSAIDPSVLFQNRESPFRAAVGFDPLCDKDKPLMGFDAPLLILHGELDDWHPGGDAELWNEEANTKLF
jgi:dienelactone hydrolase